MYESTLQMVSPAVEILPLWRLLQVEKCSHMATAVSMAGMEPSTAVTIEEERMAFIMACTWSMSSPYWKA